MDPPGGSSCSGYSVISKSSLVRYPRFTGAQVTHSLSCTRLGGWLVKIVVGVDGSAGAQSALRWAVGEACAFGCPVVAMLANGFFGRPTAVRDRSPETRIGKIDMAAVALVHEAVARLVDDEPPVVVTTQVSYEEPVDALLGAATRDDVLVVGARGLGHVRRFLLGSVSGHCVQYAPCPVVVVRQVDTVGHAGDRRSVVVGVDGSMQSVVALRWAITHTRARDLALTVVQAWPVEPGPSGGVEELLRAPGDRDSGFTQLQRLVDEAVNEGVGFAHLRRVSVRVVDGQPVKVLTDAAENAGLLVVGSRGRGGFARLLLGSTSSNCLVTQRAPSPSFRDGARSPA
jgi:nucleotide-binding universal stress UspA family protein